MKWVWTRTKYDPKYNQAPVRACLSENEALRKRIAELEARVIAQANEWRLAYNELHARAEQAEVQLAIAREALEYYACPGLGKCTRTKLKDGTCIMEVSGECGDTACTALAQTSPHP